MINYARDNPDKRRPFSPRSVAWTASDLRGAGCPWAAIARAAPGSATSRAQPICATRSRALSSSRANRDGVPRCRRRALLSRIAGALAPLWGGMALMSGRRRCPPPNLTRSFSSTSRFPVATTKDEDRWDAYFEHILTQAGVRATRGYSRSAVRDAHLSCGTQLVGKRPKRGAIGAWQASVARTSTCRRVERKRATSSIVRPDRPESTHRRIG